MHFALKVRVAHNFKKSFSKGEFSNCFRIFAGGREEAIAFLGKTKIIKRAASLGGTHSLACHPRSLTHHPKLVPEAEAEAAGITDNLIRLSVGLENVQDLIRDLDQALS